MKASNIGSGKEDFEVYEILGRGGFARVYRAKSLKTDQEVAIKIIDKKMMHHHGMTTRVRKEVELHSRLKHPSILELYTFFEDANYVYLVLEMCHNGELHRKIRENGPLSEDQARKYLKQIIDGLKYLHSYNILHRDLTLANLLLTKDMKVKIADFGLATQLEIGVEHFTMCGTPNYISPEVVSRSKQGLEADVWSVGCMLYTMLVGKAPFDTKEIKGTLNRVQIGKFHLPSNISETAKQLITGLLQTNPDKRLNLQELSVHGFMQINKSSDLFQDLSITDSGIGSMNKGHSSIDSRHSLRERNVFVNNLSQHKDQESHRYKNSTKIVESVSEIIDHQSLKGNNCSNCKNILQDSSVNKSSSDKCGYHSLFSNSVSQSSHSPYNSNINNQVSNIGNQSHSNNQKMNSSSDTSYQNILSESGSNNNNNNNNISKKKSESLNSKRLRPIRQKTRNAILNILDDETVCVEFIKSLSDSNDSKNLLKVCEVMCIDVLGQSILVYYPEKIAPVDIDKPIPLESGNKVSHFLLESIPEKYIKKYELAKKFVDLVRSKTPKLTVYTELGKCMLMENDPCPDFEIIFNVNVTVKFDSDMRSVNKIHLFGNCNKCQFFFIDDTNITIDSDSSSSQISSSINKWLDYSNKCKDYCLKVIHQINSISNSNNIVSSLFPMTIGRKTLSLNDTTGQYFHSDLVSAENLPLSILDSLSLQLKLSTPRLPASNNINLNNSYISEQSTSTFIPEIGWATQFANGELKVQFNDGCQLVIVYDSSTIEKIKWFSVNSADQSNDSTIKEFSKTDILPDEVHSKIELLPLFVKKLRNNCLQSQPRLS